MVVRDVQTCRFTTVHFHNCLFEGEWGLMSENNSAALAKTPRPAKGKIV